MREFDSPDANNLMEIVETEEAIRIIRKPNEKTIRKEILPPVFIRTKPEILIEKKPVIETKITLPPSKCDLTLNERFTLVLCHIQKKEIDPGFQELKCPNTLIGRLQRCKAARSAAAPYPTPRQSNLSTPIIMPTGLITGPGEKSKPSPFDMWQEPEPHLPGESLSSIFAKYMKTNYCTGPSKSREELDDEIEQYFISVGGRGKRVFKKKTKEMLEDSYRKQMDPDFDLNDRINNININCNTTTNVQSEEEPNLFSSFARAVRSKSIFKREKASLDQDIDDYWGSRRNQRSLSESLDDDLENYKKQDPRNQLKTQQKSSVNDNPEDDEFAEYMG
ncbi:uncharacterized protein LOC128395915 isoform X2 [Panonychus citri]|nr:uncharacterized protein LOC128395915 isoform X2 [Panonychus citri]